jgi:Rps23 Pro-64 3,4-dihydroxylase Tpa1-like proline 4-hydroxylase
MKASFQIHRDYFDKEFCDYIIENYESISEYTPRSTWKAWTVKPESIDKLVDKVKNLVPSNLECTWINITKYNTGEHLRMHNDSKSKFTVVVNLNDNYKGGEFITYKREHTLNTGDVITFNGNRVKHGVKEVTEGTRYSLNYWFNYGKL